MHQVPRTVFPPPGSDALTGRIDTDSSIGGLRRLPAAGHLQRSEPFGIGNVKIPKTEYKNHNRRCVVLVIAGVVPAGLWCPSNQEAIALLP